MTASKAAVVAAGSRVQRAADPPPAAAGDCTQRPSSCRRETYVDRHQHDTERYQATDDHQKIEVRLRLPMTVCSSLIGARPSTASRTKLELACRFVLRKADRPILPVATTRHSPGTLLSASVRLMRIFVGVPWRGASNDSSVLGLPNWPPLCPCHDGTVCDILKTKNRNGNSDIMNGESSMLGLPAGTEDTVWECCLLRLLVHAEFCCNYYGLSLCNISGVSTNLARSVYGNSELDLIFIIRELPCVKVGLVSLYIVWCYWD